MSSLKLLLVNFSISGLYIVTTSPFTTSKSWAKCICYKWRWIL